MAFNSLVVQPYRKKLSNWSHTFSCEPALVFEPTSLEEVQLIVNEARVQKTRIRPVGQHTSPGESWVTDDWMVRMHRIDHDKVDKEKRTATLGAGMLIRTANHILYEQGLSFATVGSIDEVSVGSVFAASAHNSAVKHGTLADNVIACTLVLADGTVRSLSKDATDIEERELFAATGCGCGATGVIFEVTYQLEPAFGLAPTLEKISIRETLAKGDGPGGLLDVAEKSEFVKIWYFPNVNNPTSTEPDTVLWRADRVEPPPLPPAQTSAQAIYKKAAHILHATAVFICTFVFPGLMQYFNMLQWYMQGRHVSTQQDAMPSFLAQQMDCLYWQLVNEYAVPFSSQAGYGATQAVQDFIAFLDTDKVTGGSLTAPFEIRFSSTAHTFHLSPIGHDAEAVAWLEPIVYRPLNLPVPARFKRLFDTFDGIARRHGGKPHLAKQRRPPTSEAELQSMYPKIDKWRKVVRQADPEGMFWSQFFEDQFALKHREADPKELNKSSMGKESLLGNPAETVPRKA